VQLTRWLQESLFDGCSGEQLAAKCQHMEGLGTFHGAGKVAGNYTLSGENNARLLTLAAIHSTLFDPLEPLLAGLRL